MGPVTHSERECRFYLYVPLQVFFSAGVLIAYLTGLPYWFDVDKVTVWGHEVAWWRIMIVMAGGLALAQALCLWASPESPKWLERKDKERADEACIAL